MHPEKIPDLTVTPYRTTYLYQYVQAVVQQYTIRVHGGNEMEGMHSPGQVFLGKNIRSPYSNPNASPTGYTRYTTPYYSSIIITPEYMIVRDLGVPWVA